MATRITDSNLDALCATLNRVTGSPAETYKDRKAQVGNFHIDSAYGGVALYRIANESGGCDDVLNVGHVSKRELWDLTHAYLRGIELGKQLPKG